MSISAAPSGNISAFMNSSYNLPNKASYKKSGRKTPTTSTQKVEIPSQVILNEALSQFDVIRTSLSPK